MNKYIEYYKKNPKGYWFKRKIFGWGWTPVTWQGWLVILIGLLFLFAGIYVGEKDDSPGMALLGLLVMLIIIFIFCILKGEKPRWQWGLKNSK